MKTVKSNKGFTFIELMVVVSIVAILSSIVYPSYMEHTKKTNRAQAAAVLTKVAQSQQNYLMIRRQYADSYANLSLPDQRVVDKVSQFYYYPPTMVVENGWNGDGWDHPPRFTATLIPKNGTMQEGDGHMCVSATGSVLRYCEGTPIVWYEER